jgi:predicted nucleotide-binding protein
MPKTTIFIGSSTAAKSQAKALVKDLSSATLKFLTWWEAFTAGKTLLENLEGIRQNINGAILLFSPDSEATIRTDTKWIPSLNVLFEFGYFYGCFGKSKVAMIKYGELYLPSDIGGYVYIQGSKHFTKNAVVQVGKRTKTDFEKWIQQLEARTIIER